VNTNTHIAVAGFRYSRKERADADWLAGVEIAERESALKAAAKAQSKPTPNWLNPMGADDVIRNRRLVEMPLTGEERDDLCRRAARQI
jgi:hypothetical protein